MEKQKYWFGFRQTLPPPPGNVVPCGPFDTREIAIAKREDAEAWDCQLSAPFPAASKEEAREMASELMV